MNSSDKQPQPALYGRMPYGGVYFSPKGEKTLEMHVINANVRPEHKLGAPYAVAMVTLTHEQADRLATILRDVINGNQRLGQVALPEGFVSVDWYDDEQIHLSVYNARERAFATISRPHDECHDIHGYLWHWLGRGDLPQRPYAGPPFRRPTQERRY